MCIRDSTGTTISPGALLRQCPDHYTIRAGRNLPDKEFRYLRTVIAVSYTHLDVYKRQLSNHKMFQMYLFYFMKTMLSEVFQKDIKVRLRPGLSLIHI